MSLERTLAAIDRHLDAGNYAEAYQATIEAWALERAPALAQLGARASESLSQAPTLPPPNKNAFREAWVDEVRRGDRLTLPHLLAALRGPAQLRKAALVAACLDCVDGDIEDPNLTLPLLALLREPGGSSTWTKVQTRLLKLLERVGDPAAIGPLRQLVAHAQADPDSYPPSVLASVTERVPKLIAKLEQRFSDGVPSLAPGLAATISKLVARLEGALPARVAKPVATCDEDALLAAVYASPEDDGPRAVLADLLQLKGDPRGEFIAAQLQGDDERHTKLAAKLLKKHQRQWLGPLAPYVRAGAVFERGFLARCETDVRRKATAETVFSDERWATVRELNAMHHALLTGAFRHLERAFGIPDGGLLRLSDIRLPHLTLLEVVRSKHGTRDGLEKGKPITAGLQTLARTEGLPRLAELRLRFHESEWTSAPRLVKRGAPDYAWLGQAPLARGLIKLGLNGSFAEHDEPSEWRTVLAGWVEVLSERESFPSLESLAFHNDTITSTLERTSDGLQARSVVDLGGATTGAGRPQRAAELPLWVRGSLNTFRACLPKSVTWRGVSANGAPLKL